jgi:hypothetical protein
MASHANISTVVMRIPNWMATFITVAFYCSIQNLYNKYTDRNQVSFCAEAGQNTTVALRVVRGDRKGTQCPGAYLGHSVPGRYKYGDLALQVGESQELGQSNMVESHGTQTRARLRQRGPAATVNYRPVLSSERALQNNKPATVYRKFQGEKKNWSRVPDGCLKLRRTSNLSWS